jgi:hypothetical protein
MEILTSIIDWEMKYYPGSEYPVAMVAEVKSDKPKLIEKANQLGKDVTKSHI